MLLSSVQYAIGLARLGHDVWFVEEASWEAACFDPERDEMTDDPARGIEELVRVLEPHGLGQRWAYRELGGRCHGLGQAALERLFEGADLYLDLSGSCHFPERRLARCR